MATPGILSVRVSEQERGLLVAAAANARTSLSDFIRRRAVEAAEADLLDRRVVTIPAERWAEFEAWAVSPAVEVDGVRRLADLRPAWQD